MKDRLSKVVKDITVVRQENEKNELLRKFGNENTNGNVIANFTPQVNEVISESTSYKMLVMHKIITDSCKFCFCCRNVSLI